MMKFKVTMITCLLTIFLTLISKAYVGVDVKVYTCQEKKAEVGDYIVQEIISNTHFRSEKNLWSWAASAKSVLSTYGVNTTQTDIVTRVIGSPENREATAEQIRLALEGYQVFVNGQGKKTVGDFIEIEEAIPMLEQGFLVIMGWQGGVYTLTQVSYESCSLTSSGSASSGSGSVSSIIKLTLLVPWTDNETDGEAIRTVSFSEIKEDNPIFIGVELEDSPIPPSALSIVGLDNATIKRIIDDASFRQEKSSWTWAASAKSVLSVYGINLTQSEIATRILGSPTNAGVTAYQLSQTLDGHNILVNGQHQVTKAEFLEFSEAMQILEQGLPVMVGFNGHVYTLVQKVEYYKNHPNYATSLKELTLLDPWPDNPAIQKFPLSTMLNSDDIIFIGIDLEYSPQVSNSPIQPSSLQFIQPSNDSSVHTNRLSISLALQGQVSDLLFSIDNQSIASNYRDIGVSNATGAARQVNLELDLPANLRQGQEFRLSVVASGAAGLSQPVHLDLRYQGPEQAKRELFFVAAGLNSYEDSDIRPLRFAAVDALELAAVFAEQAPQLYDDFYIKVLFTDDNPQHLLQRYLPIAQNNNLGRGDFGERLQVFYNHESTDKRMSGILSRVLREAGPEDTVVIMVSGHGVNIDGLYYIPFYDTDLNAQQSFAETSLQAHDWMTPLSRSNAQVVVFLDTCHSGAARPSNFNFKAATDAELSSPAGFADQLRNIGVQGTVSSGGHQLPVLRKSGRLAIITSTSPGELAVENERWQNGALVEAMLEALRDGALSNPQGNPQGDISMLDLISYIDRRVSTLTNNSQTPEYSLGGSNFTLLRLR